MPRPLPSAGAPSGRPPKEGSSTLHGETMAGAEMNLWVSPDGAAFAANKLFIFDWEALAHPSSRADEERGSSPPRGC